MPDLRAASRSRRNVLPGAVVPRHQPEEWRWLRELERYRERPREFLAVEQDGRIVAGALSLRLVAVDASVRPLGLGRRLLQTVEAEQIAAGAESLWTHVGHDPRGFLLGNGYVERARSKQIVYKGAPSPRLAERRFARWRVAARGRNARGPGSVSDGLVVCQRHARRGNESERPVPTLD